MTFATYQLTDLMAYYYFVLLCFSPSFSLSFPHKREENCMLLYLILLPCLIQHPLPHLHLHYPSHTYVFASCLLHTCQFELMLYSSVCFCQSSLLSCIIFFGCSFVPVLVFPCFIMTLLYNKKKM